MTITEQLATFIASDETALRQALSLINEKGYEEVAADRLHEWVRMHGAVILSPPVVSNPYPTPWHTWMLSLLEEALQVVHWNELVTRLREERGKTAL